MKKLFATIALLTSGFWFSNAAQAALYQIDFAGNPFTNVSGGYTTSMNVSGSVTVDLLSLTSQTIGTSALVSYSISDGRQVLDENNSTVGSFSLSYNSSVGIYSWYFQFNTANSYIGSRKYTACYDYVKIGTDSGCVGSISSPGAWSAPTAVPNDPVPGVPLPAALPLLLSALGGLGFIGWRRSEAAA